MKTAGTMMMFDLKEAESLITLDLISAGSMTTLGLIRAGSVWEVIVRAVWEIIAGLAERDTTVGTLNSVDSIKHIKPVG